MQTVTQALQCACDLAANYGFPVFPCKPSKQPYTTNGFKDATTSLDTIEEWWTRWPDALVGVPTGTASGLLVVDVDPAGAQWAAEHYSELLCERVHDTRRGKHYVYRMPDADIRNSASKITTGVDVRGEGGYVIWWPAHGLPVIGDLDDLTLPPSWLIDAIKAQTAITTTVVPADGMVHEPGRNEYLSREAFRLRKQGASVEQIYDVIRTVNAARCVPPVDDSELRQIAKGKANIAPATAATLDLRTTKHGVIADEENVLRILMRDPNLQGIVRFDEFSSELVLTRPISDEVIGERGTPGPWTDADTVTLQTYIQRGIIPRIARDKIEAVVAMYARKYCAFHPVRSYLQSLEWDGVKRLDTWLREYMGATEQPAEYISAVGSRFLISAVARIMEPGCQADSAMVLEGAQGIYKSTALRILAGDEYFSDSLPADLSHKDARDHLRGKWIVELSELAQFKRGEIETIKAFISRRYEQYRPSYGRHEIKFPRQCVFAGTTNADEYLVDQTGNRRFWVVACSRVDPDALTRDRNQLWAEAYARYRAGERWHLTGELADIAAAEAQARVSHDPWTGHIAEILDSRLPPINECTPGEVMNLMNLSEGERHKANAARVAQILRDLGWKKGRRDRTRGQTYTRGVKR